MTALSRSVRQRLRTDDVVWLCTLRPDGSPHLTPVWDVTADEAPGVPRVLVEVPVDRWLLVG